LVFFCVFVWYVEVLKSRLVEALLIRVIVRLLINILVVVRADTLGRHAAERVHGAVRSALRQEV